MLKAAGRADIVVESAGLVGYHVGESPDPRTQAAAKRRGVALESRARQFTAAHLDDYDLVLAMDSDHLRQLQRMGTGKARVRLFDAGDVPDPYYSDEAAFDAVFEQCWRACEALLKTL